MQTELSREYVRDAVLRAFRSVFGREPPHGLDTAPGDVPDWNSLAQVRLMHAVEQELDCVLHERFLTIGSTLAELIDSACMAVGIKDWRDAQRPSSNVEDATSSSSAFKCP